MLRFRAAIGFALTFAAAERCAAAQAAGQSELQALRAQVQMLEAQLKELSRRLDEKERAAGGGTPTAAPGATAPAANDGKAIVTDRGYSLASADAGTSIRLRALLHADHRAFFDDDPSLVNGGFVLRRARLITEGQLARNFSYLFTTEFGGGTVSILDAVGTVRVSDALQFKMGKFKTPIGLEVLQSDAATSFAERSLLAGFLPNRDLGAALTGTVANGRAEYAVGAFNGVADGANSSNADFDNDTDFAGRVMMTPFRRDGGAALGGLAFGVGAGRGRQRTAAGRAAGYRTDGQQTFFSYLPAVAAAGDVWRVSPQLEYRSGPFGLMAEYVVSSAELFAASGRRVGLRHDGWQVTGLYLVTGEASTYGQVAPRVDFDPAAGTWGALELVARYATVDLDDAAFPEFASPAASASSIEAYALGLNWFLSKAVVLKLNYYHTSFGLHQAMPFTPPAALLRRDEKAVVTRLQFAF